MLLQFDYILIISFPLILFIYISYILNLLYYVIIVFSAYIKINIFRILL